MSTSTPSRTAAVGPSGLRRWGPPGAGQYGGPAQLFDLRIDLAMERVNVDREEIIWGPFWYGCVAGTVGWAAITLQLAVGTDNSGLPGFVIAVFVTRSCSSRASR